MPREGSWERRIWEDLTSEGRTNSPVVGLTTNNGSGDAFGRLRVTQPTAIFDSQLQYDKQPLLWDEKITGSATSTHLPNESSVNMTVTTASGDSVIRQTREYFRYQPGKSQFILSTFVMGEAQEGTTKLVGYGDSENGIFLGQDGGGIFILLRSSNTGTPDDTRKVYQSEWNIDTFGPLSLSGETLDFTKTQILVIDLEWLGVGRVRVGLNINGVTYYAHEFLNANVQDKVYMTTANLPLRLEITNTQGVAASSSLKHICTTVVSEGGFEVTTAYPFSTELIDVSIPNGEVNAIAVFAARPAATFNSITNRSQFEPVSYEVAATGGTVVAKVIYNPTITGGTWGTIDSNSAVEGNSTATDYSGGIETGVAIITSGTTRSSSPVFGKTVTSRLPFGLGIDADDPTTLALVAYATSPNVTASFSFQWEEVR